MSDNTDDNGDKWGTAVENGLLSGEDDSDVEEREPEFRRMTEAEVMDIGNDSDDDVDNEELPPQKRFLR